MKINKYILPLLVASATSIFSACSSSSDDTTENTQTNTYIINETENRDIPIDAQFKSISIDQAKVKLTRDIEKKVVNIYVIKGSVEVTEVIEN
jgi:hypothetical protein